MSIELPPLLNRFVTHMNQQETAAFCACFAVDAVVEDESKTYHGLEAIRGWISNSFSHYSPTVELKETTKTANGTILTALVSGTFPGSPIMLNYHLTHDEKAISALSCEA